MPKQKQTRRRRSRDERRDPVLEAGEGSFPASDPPSFSGTTSGSPYGRGPEADPPGARTRKRGSGRKKAG